MVALAPPNLPRTSAPMNVPVRREASNTIGDVGLPSRMPTRFRLNCLPTIRPPAAARWNGDLPSRPLSTGPLKRALARTGPPARLDDHRRADRADRKPRRAELERARPQRIEADDCARRAEREASAAADLAGDRQAQRLNPAVRGTARRAGRRC